MCVIKIYLKYFAYIFANLARVSGAAMDAPLHTAAILGPSESKERVFCDYVLAFLKCRDAIP